MTVDSTEPLLQVIAVELKARVAESGGSMTPTEALGAAAFMAAEVEAGEDASRVVDRAINAHLPKPDGSGQ